MQVSELATELLEVKKRLDEITKLVKEVKRLDTDRADNLSKIQNKLQKLKIATMKLSEVTAIVPRIQNWLSAYKSELVEAERHVQQAFGNELEHILEESAIVLSGHYRSLKAGLFTLKIETSSNSFVLWYGPEQERMGDGSLSAKKAAELIIKCRERLGSRLEEEDFLVRLQKAYVRLAKLTNETKVPIVRMLSELSYDLQTGKFHTDPQREHYQSYTRADFSYDLLRLRRDSHVRLVVATRSHTKRRSDFLWVPQDEQGKGECYSHLEIMEKEQ